MRTSIPDDVSEISVSPASSRLLRIIIAAIISLGLGIGIGLISAWGIWPVEYVNADPSDLRPRYKDDYVRMISAAYVGDGNLDKARERLNQLGTGFTAKSFGDLIIREQKLGRDVQTLDALALLAQGMGYGAITIPAPTAGPETIVSNKPAPPAQAIASFQLTERAMLTCTDEPNQARLQFIVRDQDGKNLPNIGIEIRWANGEDTVYTGLKPERGVGYADFDAIPGVFTVTIPNTESEVAEDLRIGEPPANCRNDRGATPRGWKLVFQQK